MVAKTYRGEKGANAFAGMQALWDAEVASGAVVSLAEPIAYRHDLRLLVQGPVEEERTLKDLVRSTFAATEDVRAGMLDGRRRRAGQDGRWAGRAARQRDRPR